MANKDKHVAEAKDRTRRNFFRIRAVIRKDECEDMDDNYGEAHDWYQFWDASLNRWMWHSGACTLARRLYESRSKSSLKLYMVAFTSMSCGTG